MNSCLRRIPGWPNVIGNKKTTETDDIKEETIKIKIMK